MLIMAKRKSVTFTSDDESDVDGIQITTKSEVPAILQSTEDSGEMSDTQTVKVENDDTLELNASDEELFQFTSAPSSPIRTVVSAQTPNRPQRTKNKPDYFQAGLLAKEEISEHDPTSLHEAKLSKYWSKWLEGMEAEMSKQLENETWVLVKRPKHANVLKNRWVFRTKTDMITGELIHKARLCVKGFG